MVKEANDDLLKKVDKLILGEVAGPWLFGTMLFTVLIMAGQFLFQFTNYVVKGANVWKIGYLFALNIPGVFVLTFPMATLLAMLLGFGRLSGESEITAVRACGTSLNRIMVPVALFGAMVSVLTFTFSEFVVPKAASIATQIQDEIIRELEGKEEKPTWYPIVGKDGRLEANMVAQGFDIGKRELQKVTMIVYDEHGTTSSYMNADTIKYENTDEWRIIGKSEVLSATGDFRITSEEGIWPKRVPKLSVKPEDILAGTTKKLDAQNMAQLKERIETAKRYGAVAKSQLNNLQYLFWNKVTLPLAAIVYAMVGAPMGIRNHRTGAAAGFWMAILIIFGYFLLGNIMGIAANGGSISPAVAAFTPLAVGLIVSIWVIRVKNR